MYDIFISYCSKNKTQADRIYEALTNQGLLCWYAPADIYGAERFTKVIPPAIRESRVFLLLMSPAAQESKWVHRELGVADQLDKPIFTFFLEEMTLNDEFNFVLQYDQHYPATLGFKEQLSRLFRELPRAMEESGTEPVHREVPPPRKKQLPLILGAAACALALLIGVWFFFFRGNTDGSYVIWNPAYSVALSSDAHKTYYRAGETVLCKGENLTSYSQKSVWELEFQDRDSFIMRHNGQPLGVEPGHNGIGLGEDYTAIVWDLVDAGDGYCYIRNSETGFYLEWYADKGNWCTYETINEQNRELFLLLLDKAG